MHAQTRRLSTLAASLALAGLASTSALAQITMYEHDNYQGRAFTTERSLGSFRDTGFNDRASSLVVTGERWQVCDDSNYGGRCVVLRPGNYPSLTDIGLNDRVSSVRMMGEPARPVDTRPLPPTAPEPDAVVFYEEPEFRGRTFGAQQEVPDFRSEGFNNRASSIVVNNNRWEVCDGANYSGRCVVLRRGSYASLAALGLDNRISSLRMVGLDRRNPQPAEAPADPVVFFESNDFQGRTFGTQQSVANFMSHGFNDRASSIIVNSQHWQVCDNTDFGGRCVMLQPGRYPSLSAMGLNDRISSARVLAGGQAEVEQRPQPAFEPSPWQRRRDERIFVVPVTAVRAVVATPEQRCWIEQQPVAQVPRDNHNVPGAVVGAIIGGILGHQVGGGTGRDIATAGGVVAGAVVGSRVGNDGARVATQDVRRCRTVPSTTATDYWDVSYSFRGREHHVQMSTPPGPTIMVNRAGEPRV